MSDRFNSAGMRRWRRSDWFLAGLGAGTVFMGAWLVSWVWSLPDPAVAKAAWRLGVAGVLVGVWLAAAAFYLLYHRLLSRAAVLCLHLMSGDLSQTIPESGPHHLRVIARALNSLLADFQEVLLLFVVLLNDARTSMRLLQEHADEHCDNTVRSLVAGILGDLCQMRGILAGFKYYRVRIEEGTLTDAAGQPYGPWIGEAELTAPATVSVTDPGAVKAGEEEPRHE